MTHLTKGSNWAALRNPAFRNLWLASLLSGTCVAAQDTAATWLMNRLTASTLLISLMSTVAALPFFLLTLPAGAGTVIRIRSWAQDASLDGPRDEFRIDAVTGEMASSDIYADKTLGERILSRVLDIHRGGIFGWPGRLLFMLAAALMPLFMVTGFLLYFSRRRHRRVPHLAPERRAAQPVICEGG